MSDAFHGGRFAAPPVPVEDGWIDYNGHLNMAYYHLVFDRAVDLAFDALGIGPERIARTGQSFFVAEVHVVYRAEVTRADHVAVRLRMLDHDDKRLHLFLEMTREDGTLVATSEQLLLSVDLARRKVAAFAPEVAARLAGAVRAGAHLPVPDDVGRRIAPRGSRSPPAPDHPA